MARTAPTLQVHKNIWLQPLYWTLAVVAVLSLLKTTPQWTRINGLAFDQISTFKPARPLEPGVIIVAIDEPSFGEINQQWPWPRETHARLLHALREAGVRAIGFDIVFANTSRLGPQDDITLSNAAQTDTVFAADLSLVETPQASSLIRTEPLAIFLENGAKSGLANVQPDTDGVVRRLPDPQDSFMYALLNTANETPKKLPEGKKLIQFFGPPNSYPRISYYQALNPKEFLPPDMLKDKVVIVGYSLQASADVSTSDAFETPYTLKTGNFTAGVEVQATIYDNFKNKLHIKNPPRWFEYLLLAIGCLMGALIGQIKKLIPKFSLGAVSVITVIGFAWVSLKFGRLWLSPWDLNAGLLGVMSALSVRDFAIERKMRKEIQGAFSQYLSPDMVAKIVANPSLLNLGGEKRNLTIMFADIRGFTGISERFKDDPQGLTNLINNILTPLADIVMANGGTIDKFIGDCIMAFWNAPLDDPNHAQNALKAAQEMMNAIADINDKLTTHNTVLEGLTIRIGIGLNSGDCVVGNMGSQNRFDYSVLGDAVNVASRLESMTKIYKTGIIFGQDTYKSLHNTETVTEVDTIQVRGRNEPLKIYTLDKGISL
ncbi:MAG TPA: adenylate/guanylate cyclase domain-containing protein [Gammaproteobacteria bacterium]|nr:adenylate/guanylate cyclase domain-containing protein [Gammaproteobacteria bacterium]